MSLNKFWLKVWIFVCLISYQGSFLGMSVLLMPEKVEAAGKKTLIAAAKPVPTLPDTFWKLPVYKSGTPLVNLKDKVLAKRSSIYSAGNNRNEEVIGLKSNGITKADFKFPAGYSQYQPIGSFNADNAPDDPNPTQRYAVQRDNCAQVDPQCEAQILGRFSGDAPWFDGGLTFDVGDQANPTEQPDFINESHYYIVYIMITNSSHQIQMFPIAYTYYDPGINRNDTELLTFVNPKYYQVDEKGNMGAEIKSGTKPTLNGKKEIGLQFSIIFEGVLAQAIKNKTVSFCSLTIDAVGVTPDPFYKIIEKKAGQNVSPNTCKGSLSSLIAKPDGTYEYTVPKKKATVNQNLINFTANTLYYLGGELKTSNSNTLKLNVDLATGEVTAVSPSTNGPIVGTGSSSAGTGGTDSGDNCTNDFVGIGSIGINISGSHYFKNVANPFLGAICFIFYIIISLGSYLAGVAISQFLIPALNINYSKPGTSS